MDLPEVTGFCWHGYVPNLPPGTGLRHSGARPPRPHVATVQHSLLRRDPGRHRDGLALGTVCVIDRKPRTLTGAQRQALAALGRQAAAQLQLRSLRVLQRERAGAPGPPNDAPWPPPAG